MIDDREISVDFVSCENCGAPMTPLSGREYFFCEYCGSYAFPEPSSDGVVALGERGDVNCPVCSMTLSSASVAGVRVLQCPNCRGVLAQQEAFATIVKCLRARVQGRPDPVRPVNREELKREIACPYCDGTMSTHPYYGPGNVVIDNCARCAVVWLDHGELAAIRDAPGRDREHPRPPEWLLDPDQSEGIY